jgi:hypothetical protein
MPEFPPPDAVHHDATQSSYLILKYAHDTAESLLEAFSSIRSARNARGTPTDEEQDLLRAMVVFAGAGIDSMTKQLIRDALPVMATTLPAARARMEQLGARHLQRAGPLDIGQDDSGNLLGVNPQRLAKVLFAETPRAGMLELLVSDLTAGSLQSASELYRVLSYLGVDKNSIGATETELREVFDCRNSLIHEMDIDFSQPNRNRFPRPKGNMVKYAKTLLSASKAILKSIDDQLMTAQ